MDMVHMETELCSETTNSHGKKKSKKNDWKHCLDKNFDADPDKLQGASPLKNTSLEPFVTKVEDKSSEPTTNVGAESVLTSVNKKKRKLKKRSGKINTMDHESSMGVLEESAKVEHKTSEPPTDVGAESELTSVNKKRRRRFRKRSGEINTTDHESPMDVLEESAKVEDKTSEPPTDVGAKSVLTSVNNKQRKLNKRSGEINPTDHESSMGILEESATFQANPSVESLVGNDGAINSERNPSESLVSADSLLTYKKRKNKKRSGPKKKPKLNSGENLNSGSIESAASVENFTVECLDNIDRTTNSERPILNAVADHTQRRKTSRERTKKKKNLTTMQNATEGNGEVCELLEGSEVKDTLQKDKSVESSVKVSPEMEPHAGIPHIGISIALEKGEDKEQNKLYNALEQGVDAVSARRVDVMSENASVNCSDIELVSLEREKTCGNEFLSDVFDGSLEKKDGEKLEKTQITRHSLIYENNNLSECDILRHPLELDGVQPETKMQQAVSSLCNGEVRDKVGADTVIKEGDLLQIQDTLPERPLVVRSRKKLLVLDVNGLLVDFVDFGSCRATPDIKISNKAVFKRPCCDDFLQFCFNTFNVGIWTSRMKVNMDKVVNFLFGDSSEKLLFCWHRSQCTYTGFNTLERSRKPLVLKELRKLWENLEPGLPWEKGEYDATNTLLLDDSPYKSLRNPEYTALFPHSYRHGDQNDRSLGPGGALRTYLEGLAMADNVQNYVKENPFGQRAITKNNSSWNFYRRIAYPER